MNIMLLKFRQTTELSSINQNPYFIAGKKITIIAVICLLALAALFILGYALVSSFRFIGKRLSVIKNGDLPVAQAHTTIKNRDLPIDQAHTTVKIRGLPIAQSYTTPTSAQSFTIPATVQTPHTLQSAKLSSEKRATDWDKLLQTKEKGSDQVWFIRTGQLREDEAESFLEYLQKNGYPNAKMAYEILEGEDYGVKARIKL